jgi:hypothetical protein
VAPLRLGGLRGKQSTPSVWLGGTGELSAVGERERQGERTRHRAIARDNAFELFATRSRYAIHCLNKKKNVELHMIEIMMDEFN